MYIVASDCIYCGACFTECPVNAVIKYSANKFESNKSHSTRSLIKSENLSFQYAINSDICTGCADHDFPLCYSICPMNCIKK